MSESSRLFRGCRFDFAFVARMFSVPGPPRSKKQPWDQLRRGVEADRFPRRHPPSSLRPRLGDNLTEEELRSAGIRLAERNRKFVYSWLVQFQGSVTRCAATKRADVNDGAAKKRCPKEKTRVKIAVVIRTRKIKERKMSGPAS